MPLIIADLAGLVACLIAFSYVWGIWRMVRSPSRIALVVTIGYMALIRLVIFISELDAGISWIESHRTLIILPVYPLLALAFGMTYYELRSFHFDRRLPDEVVETLTEAEHEAKP
jgi:predicted Na+-dependent transporter